MHGKSCLCFVCLTLIFFLCCVPSAFASQEEKKVHTFHLSPQPINGYTSGACTVSWDPPEQPGCTGYSIFVYADYNNDGKYERATPTFSNYGTNYENSTPFESLGISLNCPPFYPEKTDNLLAVIKKSRATSIDLTPYLANVPSGSRINVLIAPFWMYTTTDVRADGTHYPSVYARLYNSPLFSFNIDKAPPGTGTVTINPECGNETVDNKTLCEITWSQFSDLSGINAYYLYEAGSLLGQYVVGSSAVEKISVWLPQGRHELRLYAVDNFGLISYTAPYYVAAYPYPVLQYWYNRADLKGQSPLYVQEKDASLQIFPVGGEKNPSYVWNVKIKGGVEAPPSACSKIQDCLNFLEDGTYSVSCTLTDEQGLSSNLSIEAIVDTTAPTIPAKPDISFIASSFVESSPVHKVRVSWQKGDDGLGTGLYQYHVKYRAAKSGKTQPSWDTASVMTVDSSATSCAIDLAELNIDRGVPYIVEVSVVAEDNMGVLSRKGLGNIGKPDDGNTASLLLPSLVTVKGISTELENPSTADKQNMLVKLTLNISQSEIDSYSKISFERVSVVGKTGLPESAVLKEPLVISDKNDPRVSMIREGGKEYAVITDSIPSSTHAGHKFVGYRIRNTIAACDFFEESSERPSALLPNTGGELHWYIKDSNGVTCLTDSKTFNVDGNVYPEGEVIVGFMGTDVDEEIWRIELDRTEKEYSSDGIDVISYTRVSGNDVTEYGAGSVDDAENGDGAAPVEYRIRLVEGENPLVFMWSEGNLVDDAWIDNRSALFNITLSPSTIDGKYTLTVTDKYAKKDSTGITVRPGEPLSIEVAHDANLKPSFDWDFGDGSTGGGPAVEHAYNPLPDKTKMTDTREYPLSLKITAPGVTDTNVSIPVYVKDTQRGELYVDEFWRGDHSITGTVIVTAPRTLTIGSDALGADMKIVSSGGVGAGYLQGIRVEKGASLIVDNAGHTVTFTKKEGQEQGWGTVFVSAGANASITGAVFEYADRGVTAEGVGAASGAGNTAGGGIVAGGGNATDTGAGEGAYVSTGGDFAGFGAVLCISNSIFRLNLIALHVTGQADVMVCDSLFTENVVYGVKEEQGAIPVMKRNRLFGNFRDYYRWDSGVIGVAALDERNPKNENNKGE